MEKHPCLEFLWMLNYTSCKRATSLPIMRRRQSGQSTISKHGRQHMRWCKRRGVLTTFYSRLIQVPCVSLLHFTAETRTGLLRESPTLRPLCTSYSSDCSGTCRISTLVCSTKPWIPFPEIFIYRISVQVCSTLRPSPRRRSSPYGSQRFGQCHLKVSSNAIFNWMGRASASTVVRSTDASPCHRLFASKTLIATSIHWSWI